MIPCVCISVKAPSSYEQFIEFYKYFLIKLMSKINTIDDLYLINMIDKIMIWPSKKPKAVASKILFIILMSINIADIVDNKEINFIFPKLNLILQEYL